MTGQDTRYRVIWGRVMRPHGNSGVVRVNFTSNLPPKTIAASCRVVCRNHYSIIAS
jgi:large subunit ribosomal protein L35Ae